MAFINHQQVEQWAKTLLECLKCHTDDNQARLIRAFGVQKGSLSLSRMVQAAHQLGWVASDQIDMVTLQLQISNSEQQHAQSGVQVDQDNQLTRLSFQHYTDRQAEDFIRVFADPAAAKPEWISALPTDAKEWLSEKIADLVALCQPLKSWSVLEPTLSEEDYADVLALSLDPKLSALELIHYIQSSALTSDKQHAVIKALNRWVNSTSRQEALLKSWKYGNYFNAVLLWLSHQWVNKSAATMMMPGCDNAYISQFKLPEEKPYVGIHAAWPSALKTLSNAEKSRLWFMNLEQGVLNYLMTLSDEQRHDYQDALSLPILVQSVQEQTSFSAWLTLIKGCLFLQQYQYINIKVALKNIRLKPSWVNRRYFVGRYRFLDTVAMRAIPDMMAPLFSNQATHAPHLSQLKRAYHQLSVGHWINYVPVIRKCWAAYAMLKPVSIQFDKSWLVYSMERLMASAAQGVPISFCQSDEFWATLLEAHTRALSRYIEKTGRLPEPTDKKQWHVFLKCFYIEIKRDVGQVASVPYSVADFPKEYLPVMKKCFHLHQPTLTEQLKTLVYASATVVLSFTLIWDMWQGLRSLWYQEHLRLGATVGKVNQLSPVVSILSQSVKDKL